MWTNEEQTDVYTFILEYVAGVGGEDVVGCNMNGRKRNVVYNWNLATDIKGGVQGEHRAPAWRENEIHKLLHVRRHKVGRKMFGQQMIKSK